LVDDLTDWPLVRDLPFDAFGNQLQLVLISCWK
jgi:hypothetical protein